MAVHFFNMLTNSIILSSVASHADSLLARHTIFPNEVLGEGTRDKALRTSAREAMLEVKLPNS